MSIICRRPKFPLMTVISLGFELRFKNLNTSIMQQQPLQMMTTRQSTTRRLLPMFWHFQASTLRLLICLIILIFTQTLAFADRGRPHISSELGFNRLLTDKNTPLRGVSLSWGWRRQRLSYFPCGYANSEST